MRLLELSRARYGATHTDHQAIAKGMAYVAMFVFIGKLAGAVKEMAVAYRYGVGAEVDAYLFVLNLISWPLGVWFSVLSVVIVPLTARMRQDAMVGLPRFRAELLGLSLLLGMTIAVITWVGLPCLMRAHWAGLPPATAALASDMLPVFTLITPLGVLIGLFSAWMLAAGRHANTLLEGIPALVIALVVLVFASHDIGPLAWGTFAGFVFHLVSLAIHLAQHGEIEAPRFTHQSPQWPAFWQGFGIMFVGQALISFIGVIDQFFAAPLGTGAIATLSYANRILALILGLGATAVSRATLPIFSQAQAQGSTHVHRVATQWIRLLFILGVASMIVIWCFAPCVVRLLFERGAFTGRDTLAVSDVLRYASVQLPFFFAALVMTSYISSQRRYMLLLWSGVIGIVCKMIGNVILIHWFGINGIALSWVVVYALNAVFFWFAVRRSS